MKMPVASLRATWHHVLGELMPCHSKQSAEEERDSERYVHRTRGGRRFVVYVSRFSKSHEESRVGTNSKPGVESDRDLKIWTVVQGRSENIGPIAMPAGGLEKILSWPRRQFTGFGLFLSVRNKSVSERYFCVNKLVCEYLYIPPYETCLCLLLLATL